MSSSIMNEDLRSIKTEKALCAAMLALLKRHSFKKITIKAICEEALISRATFYAHYIDKYDLLKHWLGDLFPPGFDISADYGQTEQLINTHMRESMPVLKNLVCEADRETCNVLFDFILSTINLNISKNSGDVPYPKAIVLSNFFAGGVLSYLSWQTEHRFPSDVPLMNRYLLEMIHAFQYGYQNTEDQETKKR